MAKSKSSSVSSASKRRSSRRKVTETMNIEPENNLTLQSDPSEAEESDPADLTSIPSEGEDSEAMSDAPSETRTNLDALGNSDGNR